MKYLADQGLIASYMDRNGKKTYSAIRRFGTRCYRFVEFHLGELSQSYDPADDSDIPAEWKCEEDCAPQQTMMDFNELRSGDEELPF